MTKHSSVTYSHRTSISSDGSILYDCPIEIRNQADLNNYHITREDCTTFSFGGTDTRTVYFFRTPDRDLADFFWKELNRDHSARVAVTRCMVPGERKALKRCPTCNSCARCPYGRKSMDKKLNVISWDRLLDDAGEFKPEECGNPTEESVILKLLLEDLQAELDSSDPRLMKALTLKALAGYSAEEIAQRLQCSTSRVYQLIQTAKQLAKKFLEQD